jgi:imidazolonepropionase-like amidohydrolase
MKLVSLPALILTAICAVDSAHAAETATNRIAIKAGRVLDIRQGRWLANQVISVEGDSIQTLGGAGSFAFPTNAEIINLTNAYVLPGLIDCHTHITSQPEEYYSDTFRRTPIDVAVVAHVYARRTLEAGITTCRDVGLQGRAAAA